MKPANTTSMAAVRSLASRSETAELSQCMEEQLANAKNACYAGYDHEYVMNVLAKASFVQKLLQNDLSIDQAMRELGRRIRRVQGSE